MKKTHPTAKKIPYEIKMHGQNLIDNYHWLRDKNWPKISNKEVLKYINEENEYAKTFFNKRKKLTDKIYKELISRIKLSDTSTPIKKRNYYYFSKTLKKCQYKIHLRKKLDEVEEIIFDENKECKNYKFFQVGSLTVSPSEKLLAYSIDTTGNEYYLIKIRDLTAKQEFEEEILNTLGAPIWSKDNQGFYYAKLNDKWRPNKIYYHKLGTSQKEDKLIYEENDNTFRVSLSKSSDEKFIFINISSSDTDEVRTIGDLTKSKILIKRKKDHLFEIDHFNNDFYIKTNDQGKNFRLVRAGSSQAIKNKNLQELIKHCKNEYLIDFNLFDNHIIITKKILGLTNIFIYDYQFNLINNINFPDAAYDAHPIYSWHDDDGVMINYSSLRTPNSTLKYIFKNSKILTLKEQEIPCGYNKDLYKTERIFIESSDNKTKIPVSLIYKKILLKNDGSNPLLLFGYGSYGISIPAAFNTNIFSLLDRGFIFAIAHIRGGDELGFQWYEEAKFLEKKKTFNDFIDVLKFFANSNFTSRKKISIMGGSAGGMLVGVALNKASEFIKSAIADVPFVDVLNTMLDDTLPLTPGEFNEWGNPKEKKYFDYIKSYSPYDNISKKEYPHVLVLAGLNDPRVTYWEPAKYVAKLREHKTDNNLLFLETEMHAGHRGKTGRFERYKEIAKKYSFLLYTHEIND